MVVRGLSRVASRQDEINGLIIPRGTFMYIPIYALNFDQDIWGPDADMFNPDRWKIIPSTASNYNFLTFLQGPRSCIGERFAELTMKVILIRLVQRLRFEEVETGRRIQKKSMITTRPRGGVFLKVSAI